MHDKSGRQAAHAPLPTAFRDEPLWDTQRTVCAASGFENPCDFLLNLRETPPLLEDMRGKGISGQRFSEKDRNSEDWHGTESRGYIGTTATTHPRTMALGRTSGAYLWGVPPQAHRDSPCAGKRVEGVGASETASTSDDVSVTYSWRADPGAQTNPHMIATESNACLWWSAATPQKVRLNVQLQRAIGFAGNAASSTSFSASSTLRPRMVVSASRATSRVSSSAGSVLSRSTPRSQSLWASSSWPR